MTELGEHQDTHTGTPQGGILSPLIFNIALSALDEHLTGPWRDGGVTSTESRRVTRRREGLATWRLVRYADDFAVLVNGSRHDAEALREQIAATPAGLGLRLSEAKTQVVHMSEGFSFLGFRIRAVGERAVATLRAWKVPVKQRCCPRRATALVQAIFVLQTIAENRYTG